jgi:hypothetical protein
MPMWGGYSGGPWSGFGWIVPLLGLLFMVGMALACFRMMGSCMTRHGGRPDTEVEALRRDVRELQEEIRKLRERT